jgi:hypothetical protein
VDDAHRLENGQNWVVMLAQGDRVVAEMSLDDWAALSATEFLVTDAVRQAIEAQRQETAGTAAGPDLDDERDMQR